MFRRARIRLTVLYIGLFALVLVAFSAIFYVGFATVLGPSFDVGPELTNEQVAQVAYQSTVDRIGLALVVGDLVVLLLVGAVAWVLASRTLGPIRDTHVRQRRFVADASHEMRTPLAAIRSSAENARAGVQSIEELDRVLGVILTSTERLTRLTNDLLMLARTDELPREAQMPEDLSVIVVETLESFTAANPGLPRITVALDPDLRIVADPTEIGRVVANLLDNAVRYGRSRETEPIRLSTRGSEREAIVEVIDQGPGIAAADLDRIFEPFHRLHQDSSGPEGNGLGLAIARSLAERNGGRLTASSRPGTGATFRLSLPRFR